MEGSHSDAFESVIPKDYFEKTWTYSSPSCELINSRSVHVGIDEAGRGPLIGHMVYCAFYVVKENTEMLKGLGVNDSKKLSINRREEIFKELRSLKYTGFVLHAAHPGYISNEMFSKKGALNTISREIVVSLISRIIDLNIKIDEIYVDTVGPSESYRNYLLSKFPDLKFRVEPKADSLYACVSAASICAKVVRDLCVNQWPYHNNIKFYETKCPRPWGSGYTSDGLVWKYLRHYSDYIFGYTNEVRFSWSTCQAMMKELCAPVKYIDYALGRNKFRIYRTKIID